MQDMIEERPVFTVYLHDHEDYPWHQCCEKREFTSAEDASAAVDSYLKDRSFGVRADLGASVYLGDKLKSWH